MPMPKLEDFEISEGRSEAMPSPAEEADEHRLAAWEQGYQAGWDDAAAAQAEDQGRIQADLARSLQGLAFTWQEARAHLLKALEPLLDGMVDRILPAIAREGLPALVLEQLMPLAEEATDQPAILELNPAVRDRVEGLVASATGLPLRIEEDADLPEGQVRLRLGQIEASIDLDRATREISGAVRAFFTLNEELPSDG